LEVEMEEAVVVKMVAMMVEMVGWYRWQRRRKWTLLTEKVMAVVETVAAV
jgi:hypothetical protein